MLPFIKKYSVLLSVAFLLTIFISLWLLPSALPALGVIFFLFTFSTAIAFIIEKHKGYELMQRKIARDILILAITLLLTILLGVWVSGWVSGLVGNGVEVRWAGWGSAVALVSATLASFAVGYALHRAAGKITRT